MKSEKDFQAVTRELFYQTFKGGEYIYEDHPKDLGWREAHLNAIKDKRTEDTVGFIRTSSYGAPDEHYVLSALLD
jgi:hypothetical protein